MTSYTVINFYKKNVILVKKATGATPVSIVSNNLYTITLDANSKYKVRKDDSHQKLVGKLWTDASGRIVEYKNYRKHSMISANWIIPGPAPYLIVARNYEKTEVPVPI